MTLARSFRDPGGHVEVKEDRVLRWVHAAAVPTLERFLASPVYDRWVQAGNMVGTQPSTLPQNPGVSPGGPAAFEHPRIPFPSYPHEWPPSLLAKAGRLTLDIHESLLEQGLGLKDATPTNILFEGVRPVFVDVLSVEGRAQGDAFWLAYAQFTRYFLIPLLLWRDVAWPPHEALLASPDGVTPESAYARYGPLRRIVPPRLGLITLPTWLGRRPSPAGTPAMTRARRPDEARFIHRSLVRGLRRRLDKLAQPIKRRSGWSEYDRGRSHYSPEAAEAKDAFVRQAVRRQSPRWVLDLGCNTGRFAFLAAEAGARVVACDSDATVVDALARAAAQREADILPLVVDAARPTPATGWRNQEAASFLERARGRFDTVMALGLLHHLLVTARVPLADLLAQWVELARRGLVVEFVGIQDPMFQQLSRGRDHLHAGLSPETFESAAANAGLHVEARQALPGMDRVLYDLRRV